MNVTNCSSDPTDHGWLTIDGDWGVRGTKSGPKKVTVGRDNDNDKIKAQNKSKGNIENHEQFRKSLVSRNTVIYFPAFRQHPLCKARRTESHAEAIQKDTSICLSRKDTSILVDKGSFLFHVFYVKLWLKDPSPALSLVSAVETLIYFL